MTTSHPGAGTYTMREAAERLGIDLARAYRLDNDGAFPVEVLYFGAVRKVRIADMERYLAGPADTATDPAESRRHALLERLQAERPAATPAPALTLIRGSE